MSQDGTYELPTGVLLDKYLEDFISTSITTHKRFIMAVIAYIATMHFGRKGFLEMRMSGPVILYKVTEAIIGRYRQREYICDVENMEYLTNYAFVDEKLFWFKKV